MKGMLAPKFREVIIGHAEVPPDVYTRLQGRHRVRLLCAGRQDPAQLPACACYRDNIVIYEGKLASLRRFKDDVKEVAAGYECGMQVEKFNDIKEGDVIECFVNEQL